MNRVHALLREDDRARLHPTSCGRTPRPTRSPGGHVAEPVHARIGSIASGDVGSSRRTDPVAWAPAASAGSGLPLREACTRAMRWHRCGGRRGTAGPLGHEFRVTVDVAGLEPATSRV